MDIFIAIDEKERTKCIFKAEAIKKELEKANMTTVFIDNVENMKIENLSLCIVFTNEKEYIEKVHKNKKLEIICITSKLSSEYILDILNYSKDIYFLNTRTDEMVRRIIGFVRNYEDRKKCIRGNINEF